MHKRQPFASALRDSPPAQRALLCLQIRPLREAVVDSERKGGHRRPLCGDAGLRLREEAASDFECHWVRVNCRKHGRLAN